MKKKIVWFSLFSRMVPADFEEWMEGLAKEGWNVDKLGMFGAFRIEFHKSEPRKYRYVFDLNIFPKRDYKPTYEEFGWEYVGRMSNCFIWRKEYSDVRPESFADKESLIQRNKLLKNTISVILALMLGSIIFAVTGSAVLITRGEINDAMAFIPMVVLVSGIGIYLSWVIRQISKNIER